MSGFDDPRVVPVYAITQGRTRSGGRDLPWETLVVTADKGLSSLPSLRFEQARIVDRCCQPMSVAEIAADLGVPLGVASVLVSDLHADGLLVVHRPNVGRSGRPEAEVLERLLRGLRAQS